MKTILVIDDEAYFGESMKDTLDAQKYKVISAKDGEEGIKMIEEAKPDAVLLDINMPGLSGLEVLKKLGDKTKQVPIIITSNLSARETIGEGIALGARGYIIKSNESPHTIADTIDNLFK